MKKTITILLVSIITTFSFGQIDDEIMNPSWKTGKEKIIYGNTIFRHLGENNRSGMLNVGYEKYSQARAKIEKDADSEMWTPEKKHQVLESADKFLAGGVIHIYLTRLTIDAANAEWFTLIVKDSTDTNEIYRKELKRKTPNVPSRGTDYWWNNLVAPIPVNTSGKIYIYIIDRLGQENNKFKFEVNL